MAQIRTPLILVAIVALLVAACGGDNNGVSDETAAQPQTQGTSFVGGEFAGLPLPEAAEAFGTVSGEDGVTTQSYEIPGRTAEQVLRFYEEQLTDAGWTATEDPQESGNTDWTGAWTDEEGRFLEVSATPLSPDEPDSTVTQFSLVLHEDAGSG